MHCYYPEDSISGVLFRGTVTINYRNVLASEVVFDNIAILCFWPIRMASVFWSWYSYSLSTDLHSWVLYRNEIHACIQTDYMYCMCERIKENFLGQCLSNLYLISLFIPENADMILTNFALNPGDFLEQKWDDIFPFILHSLILRRIQPNHFSFSNFLSVASVWPLLIQI
jgi:hypothetical protein